MEIKEIQDKEIWENFLSGCKEKSFLDSWNWGEFQKMMESKIWRLGIFEGNELISVALIIEIRAKRGTFLFLPHAPSVALAKEGGPTAKYEILKILLEELKKIAKEEKAIFIRIAPIWEKNEENNKIFKDFGFKNAPIHIHPETTWELDITPSEEELLAGMRKTTRYLIKQAQKNKEIEIIQSPAFANATTGKQDLKDVEIFNKIYQETVDRHHFTPFSLNYLKNEFSIFRSDNQASIFLGKYKNEVISSAIILFWSGIGFYHQGASSLKYSKIPASYLLQWGAIKEAKKRGCKIYNFWGINPKEKKNHPWAGLTLFKMGFGGYQKEYVKTQDFVLSKKYWLTFLFEKLRKAKRGL